MEQMVSLHSERRGLFPMHLDSAVQKGAVKSLTPGGEY